MYILYFFIHFEFFIFKTETELGKIFKLLLKFKYLNFLNTHLFIFLLIIIIVFNYINYIICNNKILLIQKNCILVCTIKIKEFILISIKIKLTIILL